MVLLDEMVERTSDAIRCVIRLRPDMPFMRQGRQRAAVVIEYMAQAAAAFAGLSKTGNGKPNVGYVVGVRRLSLPPTDLIAGTTLTVTARMTWQDVQTAAFECAITEGGETIAEAELTVVDTGAKPVRANQSP
jgi:predicted hotdog family 3-hydroxylacyl-ACP dehydratase